MSLVKLTLAAVAGLVAAIAIATAPAVAGLTSSNNTYVGVHPAVDATSGSPTPQPSSADNPWG
ncbi:MAG: hypothetical protein J2P15_18500 [Micromonosporaceae bacterium]|nr:hypothetical protein [Micromonosporaceae bacterium]